MIEFFSRNKRQIKNILTESNSTVTIKGGTTELTPFASLEGYYKYSKLRSENNGYTYVNDMFDPRFVYGNVGEPNGSFSVLKEDVKRLLSTYEEIDKLYLEYISQHVTGFSDHVIASDGSDYDTQSGTMDGKYTDTTKTSVYKPLKNPPGFDGISKADALVDTNIRKMTSTSKNKLIDAS